MRVRDRVIGLLALASVVASPAIFNPSTHAAAAGVVATGLPGHVSIMGQRIDLSHASARVAAAPFQVVASGLNNPRHLSFGDDGGLYVAEAGAGGTGACITSPEGGTQCYGPTGAVTRIYHGTQSQWATGLPSVANADGSSASGPADVAFFRTSSFGNPGLAGRIDAFVTVQGVPGRETLGAAGASFGQLIHINPDGSWSNAADLYAYEYANDPVGDGPDSDPYALVNDRNYRIVADAAANDLVRVDPAGHIAWVAKFPARFVPPPPGATVQPALIPMQAVPDSIKRGPDGNYYVGELTGFPFPPGGARVYRFTPGRAPQIWATGFTNIIDLTFGPDGSLYVLEIAANGLLSNDITGALIKIAPNGDRTTLASDGLVAPTGVVIGPDNAAYVSNYGIFAGAGQVVRIPLS